MASNRCTNVESDVNVKAFLKLIRYAEHKREDDGVYYLLYGGQQTFTDTSKHPKKSITAWGRTSTAAGAYQIIYATWESGKEQGVAQDFTPFSQDKIAIWLIRTKGALPLVLDGKVEDAIIILRPTWTSLPGASQSKMQMSEAKQLFSKYVAEYSER